MYTAMFVNKESKQFDIKENDTQNHTSLDLIISYVGHFYYILLGGQDQRILAFFFI
jgi:cytochrome oxidase Cu insertion factor (SCO1/SenC/PrrC family)